MLRRIDKFYQKFLGVIAINILFLNTIKSQNCVDSRLRAGQCVTLDKCPQIVEEFYDEARQSSYGVDFQTFISNSICGFDGRTFLICCRFRYFNQPPTNNPTTGQNQNSPIVFGVPYSRPSSQTSQSVQPLQPSPTSAADSSSNVFLFAPLSAVNPVTSPPQSPPPMVIPNTTTPTVVNPSSSSSTPIVFRPSFPSPASSTTATPSSPSSVFQPMPPNTPGGAGGGGGVLISQTVPRPGGGSSSSTSSFPATQATQQGGGGGGGITCGINRVSTNRVVGGVEAKRGSYPWIAALGFRDEYENTALKFLCGGSLISSKYVITSAHCINKNLVLIRLGAHDITNPGESNARDYRIKRTVVHESFDLKSISNDIALVELMQPVAMSNFIGPICLPETQNFMTQDFVGMNPFIAGWGAKKHQGATSSVLLDAQVPIVSRQSCEQSYRTIFNFVQFSDKLICAGNSNFDACQGDSGGPLMLPQMNSGKFNFYLIGVVSYGYECARAGFPGVYTRVAAYMPWIKRNMI